MSSGAAWVLILGFLVMILWRPIRRFLMFLMIFMFIGSLIMFQDDAFSTDPHMAYYWLVPFIILLVVDVTGSALRRHNADLRAQRSIGATWESRTFT